VRGEPAEDKPRPDRRRSLAGVPVFNDNVEIDRSDPEKWVLTMVTRRRQGKFSARFLPATSSRRLELDELGSVVVRLIDGNRDVKQIISEFQQQYNLNRRESELSVVEFLKALVGRGIIAIAIK